MDLLDAFSLCLSILGIYGLMLYPRFLLPRNIVPYVAERLSEALQILDRAQSIGAIPQASEYRTTLAIFENQFLRMRTESHRSPGISQQLFLAIRRGITCKLYVLYLRIEAAKVEIELAVDERQLRSLTMVQGAATTALPNPLTSTYLPFTPMNSVPEPPPTPPDSAP
ncbi:hypothetical protein BJV74DRAFT_615233 [Russula compacta]|nr:hypothetical protein BJV74DRAFT_615233 [Russula compacta]